MERVLDAGLLLLHLRLGRRADLDHRHAADQLGEPLLQLLAVVVGSRLLDLRADLLDAPFDVLLLPRAVDDGGVLLVDGDALGAAQIVEGELLELLAQLFRDHLPAGEDGDVLEHLLAPIAEAGGLHRGDLERAAKLVDDQRGERLALDLLGDEDDGPAGADHLLEDGDEVRHGGDLPLADEDVGLVELDHHAGRIGDEVRRDVAAVELHALDHLEGRLQALGLLDGDDALLAHLLHRLGEDVADGLVAVGGDGADLGDLRLALGLGGELLQLGDDGLDRLVDSALERHRVVARRHQPLSLAVDGGRQDGGRSGAVAGDVAGLGGHLADHLRAHVLEAVGEIDLLRHRDAILGDGGSSPGLLQDHVAALGTEGHGDRIAENPDAAKDLLPRRLRKSNLLRCHLRASSLTRAGARRGGANVDRRCPLSRAVLKMACQPASIGLRSPHLSKEIACSPSPPRWHYLRKPRKAAPPGRRERSRAR